MIYVKINLFFRLFHSWIRWELLINILVFLFSWFSLSKARLLNCVNAAYIANTLQSSQISRWLLSFLYRHTITLCRLRKKKKKNCQTGFHSLSVSVKNSGDQCPVHILLVIESAFLLHSSLLLYVVFSQLLRKENLDLKLTPYKVLATSTKHGMNTFIS